MCLSAASTVWLLIAITVASAYQTRRPHANRSIEFPTTHYMPSPHCKQMRNKSIFISGSRRQHLPAGLRQLVVHPSCVTHGCACMHAHAHTQARAQAQAQAQAQAHTHTCAHTHMRTHVHTYTTFLFLMTQQHETKPAPVIVFSLSKVVFHCITLCLTVWSCIFTAQLRRVLWARRHRRGAARLWHRWGTPIL